MSVQAEQLPDNISSSGLRPFFPQFPAACPTLLLVQSALHARDRQALRPDHRQTGWQAKSRRYALPTACQDRTSCRHRPLTASRPIHQYAPNHRQWRCAYRARQHQTKPQFYASGAMTYSRRWWQFSGSVLPTQCDQCRENQRHSARQDRRPQARC